MNHIFSMSKKNLLSMSGIFTLRNETIMFTEYKRCATQCIGSCTQTIYLDNCPEQTFLINHKLSNDCFNYNPIDGRITILNHKYATGIYCTTVHNLYRCTVLLYTAVQLDSDTTYTHLWSPHLWSPHLWNTHYALIVVLLYIYTVFQSLYTYTDSDQ